MIRDPSDGSVNYDNRMMEMEQLEILRARNEMADEQRMTYKLDSISDEEAKRQAAYDGDVWIDAPMTNHGLDPKFFGTITVSYPYGVNGPAAGSVKFNLTAYIKHLIEKQGQ